MKKTTNFQETVLRRGSLLDSTSVENMPQTGRLLPLCDKQSVRSLQSICGADSSQSGRSMIEMLGVLAIIGALSVGGIAGYTSAMERHKLNKLNQFLTSSTAMTQQLLIKSDNIRQSDIQYVIDQQSSYHANVVMCAYDSNNHPVYALAGIEIAQNICKIMQPAINVNFQYSIPNVFVGKNCQPAPIDCSSAEDLSALQFIWDEESYNDCNAGACPEFERDSLGEYCGPDSIYCPVGCASGGSRACNTGCNGSDFYSYSGNGELMSIANATTRCPSTENGTTCEAGNYCALGCIGTMDCVSGCVDGHLYSSDGAITECPCNETGNACYHGSSDDGCWYDYMYGKMGCCKDGVCTDGWGNQCFMGLDAGGYGTVCASDCNGSVYDDAGWHRVDSPICREMERLCSDSSKFDCFDSEIYGCDGNYAWQGQSSRECSSGCTTCDGVGGWCTPSNARCKNELDLLQEQICTNSDMRCGSYGIEGCQGNIAWHGSYSESCSNGCTTCGLDYYCSPSFARCRTPIDDYAETLCTDSNKFDCFDSEIYGCEGNYAWQGQSSRECSSGCTTCYGGYCQPSEARCATPKDLEFNSYYNSLCNDSNNNQISCESTGIMGCHGNIALFGFLNFDTKEECSSGCTTCNGSYCTYSYAHCLSPAEIAMNSVRDRLCTDSSKFDCFDSEIYGCEGNYAWQGQSSRECSSGCTTCDGGGWCTPTNAHCK